VAIDVEAFQETLVHRVTATSAAIVADMDALRRLDKAAEARSARWNTGCGISLIVLLLAFLGACVTFESKGETPTLFEVLPIPALVAMGASLLGGAVCWFMRKKVIQLDVEDKRYDLVTRLLHTLDDEIAPEIPLELTLDLHPTKSPEELDHTEQAGEWQVAYYINRWLELHGRFKDATRFELRMTETLEDRTRPLAAGAEAGNAEIESEQISSTRATVVLWVEGREPAELQALTRDAAAAILLPELATFKGAKVEEGGLVVRVTTPVWNAPPPGQDDRNASGTLLITEVLRGMRKLLGIPHPG